MSRDYKITMPKRRKRTGCTGCTFYSWKFFKIVPLFVPFPRLTHVFHDFPRLTRTVHTDSTDSTGSTFSTISTIDQIVEIPRLNRPMERPCKVKLYEEFNYDGPRLVSDVYMKKHGLKLRMCPQKHNFFYKILRIGFRRFP